MAQTQRSAISSNSAQVELAPTGTATTIRAGCCRLSAATAARIVEPVARPSSIKITVFPLTGDERAPAAIDRLAALELPALGLDLGPQLFGERSSSASMTSSFTTTTPPEAMAPIASSS